MLQDSRIKLDIKINQWTVYMAIAREKIVLFLNVKYYKPCLKHILNIRHDLETHISLNLMKL